MFDATTVHYPLFSLLKIMNIKDKKETLATLYATTSNVDLSRMLGLSVGMVQRYAGQMGLRKSASYISKVYSCNGMKGYMARHFRYGNNTDK